MRFGIIIVSYFFARHKNRRVHNQHLKLLFSKTNFDFGTSDKVSKYGKLNLHLINSIFVVFSSGEMQRRLIQAKGYYKLFYSVSEALLRSVSETFKRNSKIKSFPSVFIIDTTCFDESFLFWKRYFLPFILKVGMSSNER